MDALTQIMPDLRLAQWLEQGQPLLERCRTEEQELHRGLVALARKRDEDWWEHFLAVAALHLRDLAPEFRLEHPRAMKYPDPEKPTRIDLYAYPFRDGPVFVTFTLYEEGWAPSLYPSVGVLFHSVTWDLTAWGTPLPRPASPRRSTTSWPVAVALSREADAEYRRLCGIPDDEELERSRIVARLEPQPKTKEQ